MATENNQRDWISDIAARMTIDMLPESYQAVAEIIGVANTLKLANHLGGSGFYFRQIGGLYRRKRDEMIRAEFTGLNHRELARKYNLTESWIREIVEHKPAETADMFEKDDD